MWHKWWDHGRWSDWVSKGGILRSDPAVVSWGPDRVDTFHRGTDNALWHNWSINGGWSGWQSLGGVLTSTPTVISKRQNQL